MAFSIIDMSGRMMAMPVASGNPFSSLPPLQSTQGLVIHHTAERGDVQSIMNTFAQHGTVAQFVMDRNGQVYQMTPNGSSGWQIATGHDPHYNNLNTIGIEVIAKDNNDWTPAQKAAIPQFYHYLKTDPTAVANWGTQNLDTRHVFGHGDLDKIDKEPSEGQTGVAAIRAAYPVSRQAGPGAVPAPNARAIPAPGSFPLVGAAPGRSPNLKQVDPRLVEAVSAGAAQLPAGYKVTITEGYNPSGHVALSQHHIAGRGALDVQITDPNGNVIPREGNDPTGMYQRLAQGAYGYTLANHPELNGKLAWGGSFATTNARGNTTRDLMHFDIGGERGNLFPTLSKLGPLAPGAAAAAVAGADQPTAPTPTALVSGPVPTPAQQAIQNLTNPPGGTSVAPVSPRDYALGRFGPPPGGPPARTGLPRTPVPALGPGTTPADTGPAGTTSSAAPGGVPAAPSASAAPYGQMTPGYVQTTPYGQVKRGSAAEFNAIFNRPPAHPSGYTYHGDDISSGIDPALIAGSEGGIPSAPADPAAALSWGGNPWAPGTSGAPAAAAGAAGYDQRQAPVRNLTVGMRGPDVMQVQNQLRALGFNPGAADGVYGQQTRAAVLRAQTAVDPKGYAGPNDGVAGVWTQGMLQRLAPPPTPPMRPIPTGRLMPGGVPSHITPYSPPGPPPPSLALGPTPKNPATGQPRSYVPSAQPSPSSPAGGALAASDPYLTIAPSPPGAPPKATNSEILKAMGGTGPMPTPRYRFALPTGPVDPAAAQTPAPAAGAAANGVPPRSMMAGLLGPLPNPASDAPGGGQNRLPGSEKPPGYGRVPYHGIYPGSGFFPVRPPEAVPDIQTPDPQLQPRITDPRSFGYRPTLAENQATGGLGNILSGLFGVSPAEAAEAPSGAPVPAASAAGNALTRYGTSPWTSPSAAPPPAFQYNPNLPATRSEQAKAYANNYGFVVDKGLTYVGDPGTPGWTVAAHDPRAYAVSPAAVSTPLTPLVTAAPTARPAIPAAVPAPPAPAAAAAAPSGGPAPVAPAAASVNPFDPAAFDAAANAPAGSEALPGRASPGVVIAPAAGLPSPVGTVYNPMTGVGTGGFGLVTGVDNQASPSGGPPSGNVPAPSQSAPIYTSNRVPAHLVPHPAFTQAQVNSLIGGGAGSLLGPIGSIVGALLGRGLAGGAASVGTPYQGAKSADYGLASGTSSWGTPTYTAPGSAYSNSPFTPAGWTAPSFDTISGGPTYAYHRDPNTGTLSWINSAGNVVTADSTSTTGAGAY